MTANNRQSKIQVKAQLRGFYLVVGTLWGVLQNRWSRVPQTFWNATQLRFKADMAAGDVTRHAPSEALSRPHAQLGPRPRLGGWNNRLLGGSLAWRPRFGV